MSDRIKSAPDVPWLKVGAGLSSTFRCALCFKPRQVPGRRLRRVHGVKQWCCKECSK